jgi:hypothetical protein
MALNIKIDVNDCYAVKALADNLTLNTFDSILQNGNVMPIGIHISEKAHPLMPNVYNLAFGPIDQDNQIDDKAKLCHQDHSKLFSTIVYTSLSYLKINSDKFLGIDGSSNARAYLYYRCMQNNLDYLNQYLNIYGVNYYVRVLRKLKLEDKNNPIDEDDVIALPNDIVKESFLKYDKLYNYFIFNKIQQ